MILHLYKICKQHQITEGKLEINCDGLSAIQQLNYYRPGSYISGLNFDLINAITAIRDKLPLQITFQHIKGHQDKGSAYSSLSRLAQLNVLADYLAKAEANRQVNINSDHQYDSLPFSPCKVIINTKSNKTIKINSMLTKSLQVHLTVDKCWDYWVNKHKLKTWTKAIDWELQSKSLNNVPSHQQRWLSKFLTGFCGVGKMLRQYRWQDHTKCPRCSMDNEDTQHVHWQEQRD